MKIPFDKLNNIVLLTLVLASGGIVSFSCHKKSTSKSESLPAGKLTFNCTDWKDSATIPDTFSCKSAHQILPKIQCTQAPSGTKSLVLIMDDPDAVPVAGYVWIHWLVWDLPVQKSLTEHDAYPTFAVIGKTSFGKLEYGGPCPPSGQKHQYFLRLFALDIGTLGISSNSENTAVRAAMKGHVLDSAVYRGFFKQ